MLKPILTDEQENKAQAKTKLKTFHLIFWEIIDELEESDFNILLRLKTELLGIFKKLDIDLNISHLYSKQ